MDKRRNGERFSDFERLKTQPPDTKNAVEHLQSWKHNCLSGVISKSPAFFLASRTESGAKLSAVYSSSFFIIA